ncbi:hypothetical protein PIB30_092585 [Stylosanthes scabra]|uniref:Uncharacterized protein n=1 Tax=Stylosanthes scabra TaxID=79078 RepID=A0ABU6VVZ8_9FABA|nr:hypothetical protein [Stylosanthes scabra]
MSSIVRSITPSQKKCSINKSFKLSLISAAIYHFGGGGFSCSMTSSEYPSGEGRQIQWLLSCGLYGRSEINKNCIPLIMGKNHFGAKENEESYISCLQQLLGEACHQHQQSNGGESNLELKPR